MKREKMLHKPPTTSLRARSVSFHFGTSDFHCLYSYSKYIS